MKVQEIMERSGIRETGRAISYIEDVYPETAKEFQKIQFEQYLTFCKKQMDYGPSNISMGTGIGESVNQKLSLTTRLYTNQNY